MDPAGLATILATVVKLLIETAHALVNLKDKGMHATDETPDHTRARGPATRGGEEKGKTFTGTEVGWREKKRQWRQCIYESSPTGYLFIATHRNPRPKASTILFRMPLEPVSPSGVLTIFALMSPHSLDLQVACFQVACFQVAVISQHAGLVLTVEPDVDLGEDTEFKSAETHVTIILRCSARG